MLSESISQAIKLPSPNDFILQQKNENDKSEIKRKQRKIDSLPPKIIDLTPAQSESVFRIGSANNSVRRGGARF